jgi:hypothetical protein
MPLTLPLLAAAGFVVIVLIAGMIWPRFLTWMAHAVTLIAGVTFLLMVWWGAFAYTRVADLIRDPAAETARRDQAAKDFGDLMKKLGGLEKQAADETKAAADLLKGKK